MERTGWIAYVNEGFSHAAGEQHPWAWAAATFNVQIAEWPPPGEGEYPTQTHPDDSPRGMQLKPALAWARERATRVEVSLAGGVRYSAGERPTSARPLPVGFTVVPRRTPGAEFFDRLEGDPPISWDVIVEASVGEAGTNGWEGAETSERRAWHAALDASGGCECLEVIARYENPWATHSADGSVGGLATDETTPVAVLRLTAVTYAEATGKAAQLANAAALTAGWTTTQFVSADAYPSGSGFAAQNAHVA